MPYICGMIKTFDDLIFLPHPNRMVGCVQCQYITDNGYVISIVGGPHLYGDGESTFEVAAWSLDGDQPWVKLSPYDDVIGHRSKDDVMTIISDIESGVFKHY